MTLLSLQYIRLIETYAQTRTRFPYFYLPIRYWKLYALLASFPCSRSHLIGANIIACVVFLPSSPGPLGIVIMIELLRAETIQTTFIR